MVTNESGNSKAKARIMLHSRKKEKMSPVNIVQKKDMMKTIVGKFILK